MTAMTERHEMQIGTTRSLRPIALTRVSCVSEIHSYLPTSCSRRLQSAPVAYTTLLIAGVLRHEGIELFDRTPFLV
jgi:hypothetical protein